MEKNMKGLMAIRAAKALVNGRTFSDAIELTKRNDPMVSAFLEKAFVAGSTLEGALEMAGQAVARELGEFIFSQSIPGKLLANAQRLPFGTALNSISGIGADWVTEGESLPCRRGSTSSAQITPFKMASMAVITQELLRLAATGSDIAIRNTLTSEAVKKIDTKFLSVDAEVEDLSPAGMLLGATTATDFAGMFQAHVDNGNTLSTSALVLPISDVFSLTEAQFKQFNLLGIQLLASQNATQTALIDAGNTIINVQGALVDTSLEGTVEMTDAPAGNISDDTGASDLVSLFQTNSAALRSVTYCAWAPVGSPATVLSAP